MVSIKWCLKQNKGLELIEPNENMSDSYLKMAEESIEILDKLKESDLWTATTSYYIFYYSLYSLMLKIGIKCEIHSCSLKFMKQFLKEYYNNKDIEMIEKAFSARIDLQYYADRPVDKEIIENSKQYCKTFFIKTKNIISNITEDEIEKIRNELKNYLFLNPK